MPSGDEGKDEVEESEECVDDEDLLPDSRFIRLVHAIAWLLTVVFSILSIAFIGYQLYALYVPYVKAKLVGDTSYRFPEYFYRVYGNDIVDLTSEHWGYLGACAAISFISIRYVVPKHPFASRGADAEAHRKSD
mmetsp:Transcript_50767/g.147871  ORF Transcript_50767/g.147871 Transcript_50767/m.147871 type:complete len:134 (-) Transcript_50767:131-532(-)